MQNQLLQSTVTRDTPTFEANLYSQSRVQICTVTRVACRGLLLLPGGYNCRAAPCTLFSQGFKLCVAVGEMAAQQVPRKINDREVELSNRTKFSWTSCINTEYSNIDRYSSTIGTGVKYSNQGLYIRDIDTGITDTRVCAVGISISIECLDIDIDRSMFVFWGTRV